MPSLLELEDGTHKGLHTLYLSPLKALAADIKRNLQTPIDEMDLPIRVEDRTGDTSNTQKKRQRAEPPHILDDAQPCVINFLPRCTQNFQWLKRIVIDEIHALAESKRGDQMMLALSRLQSLCPDLRRVGLSATVDDPDAIAKTMAAAHPDPCPILFADPGLIPRYSDADR